MLRQLPCLVTFPASHYLHQQALMEERSLLVKHTFPKIVGWLGVAFFLFCGVSAWLAGARWPAAFFLGFVAVGIYLILSAGSMEMDSQGIKYHLPLASYEIRWSDVKSIEIDPQGGNIVFIGEGKRLAALGPVMWSGKDKLEMRRLIGAQMKKGGIEMKTTGKAMLRLSKNTRVTE
ncbi:MAG: hypothetical protein ACRD6N_13250 [Pyrinomonadaceae bacterium]